MSKNLSWSTFNQCVSGLRFLYGTTLGRPEVLPRIPYGRRPKRIPEVLSQVQVQELLACIQHRGHRMLLTTIYATGLRLKEATHLRVTDIDSEQMTILVAHGKGNKQRLVPLSLTLLKELREWWREHRNPQWLFPGNPPEQPLGKSAVQKAFKLAAARARLKPGTTVHTLRHTFATELLEAGVDLLTIQKILGHSNLNTTLIYTHVRRDHLRAVSRVQGVLPLQQLCRPAFPPKPTSRGKRASKSPK